MPTMPEIARTREEIWKQLELAAHTAYDGAPSKYHAMTYEHGVIDAINWMLGDEDDSPMGDEEDDDA